MTIRPAQQQHPCQTNLQPIVLNFPSRRSLDLPPTPSSILQSFNSSIIQFPRRSGNSYRTINPPIGDLCAEIVPPFASTVCLAIASPKPAPFVSADSSESD